MKLVINVALICVLTACGSTRSRSDSDQNMAPPQETRTPMGLGYPDPQALMDGALRNAASGDVAGWVESFAFVDENGTFFAGNAKEMPKESIPGIKDMRNWAAAMRMVSSPRFVTQVYGKPRNIRNTPPTIEVAVTRLYRLDSPSDEERTAILASINSMLPRSNPINWGQLKRRLLNAPKTHRQRFVFLDGRWRIDASWKQQF